MILKNVMRKLTRVSIVVEKSVFPKKKSQLGKKTPRKTLTPFETDVQHFKA
jgi:hypothetical protein